MRTDRQAFPIVGRTRRIGQRSYWQYVCKKIQFKYQKCICGWANWVGSFMAIYCTETCEPRRVAVRCASLSRWQPNGSPLHTPTQDAVDLPKMVQVVCRFQADELLHRLPSAYLVDPITLHPPCARDRLQQSQVALAQRPKDPCRKARILLRVTQALRPCRLIPPR